jgi:hypothetical protein
LAGHLNIPPHLLGLAEHPTDPLESPVNRREFLTGAAAVLATAAVPTPLLDTAVTSNLEGLRDITAGYRRMDGTLASHDLVRPVVSHLDMTPTTSRTGRRPQRTGLAGAIGE